MTAVLFVCLGNICRSPAAEEILRQFVKAKGCENQIHIESCGIGAWHIGLLPNSRMRTAAQARGFILTSRAQLFQQAFLDTFDYILAADGEVMEYLHQQAVTTDQKAKIHLITEFSDTYKNRDVPDPYYKGNGAFEEVLDILEDSCQGLLKKICKP